MNIIDLSLIETEKKLSRKFSYDLHVHQLHLIGRRGHELSFQPEKSTMKLANIFLIRLLSYFGKEDSLQNTLLYIQSRELIINHLNHIKEKYN